jgi:hypothetical protein
VGFVLLNILVISSVLVSHYLFLGQRPTTATFFEKHDLPFSLVVATRNNNNNNNKTQNITTTTKKEEDHATAPVAPTRQKNKTLPKVTKQKNITHTLLKRDLATTLKKLSQIGSLNVTTILEHYSPQDLPPWSSIERQYGKEPLILGLDQCQEYRDSTLPQHRWVAPAGLFHSGTNLMAGALASSCFGISPHWQVPWGKHNPWKAHSLHTIDKPLYQQANVSNVLPIVMVRHFLDWMPSMCREPYTAKWNHSNGNGCPSLQDAPVTVGLYQTQAYDHLVDFWKTWNAEYHSTTTTTTATATAPRRLMVRLEDLVYHPEATLQTICTCVGGYFKYTPPPNDRQGGTSRKKTEGVLPLVEAWKRHARLPRLDDARDRQIVQNDTELLQLLEALHYYQIDSSV